MFLLLHFFSPNDGLDSKILNLILLKCDKTLLFFYLYLPIKIKSTEEIDFFPQQKNFCACLAGKFRQELATVTIATPPQGEGEQYAYDCWGNCCQGAFRTFLDCLLLYYFLWGSESSNGQQRKINNEKIKKTGRFINVRILSLRIQFKKAVRYMLRKDKTRS
jgi:hypothetical protein